MPGVTWRAQADRGLSVPGRYHAVARGTHWHWMARPLLDLWRRILRRFGVQHDACYACSFAPFRTVLKDVPDQKRRAGACHAALLDLLVSC